MKKMIFSAIALTAFSFAGMANEIEEKSLIERTICEKYGDEQYTITFLDTGIREHAELMRMLAKNRCEEAFRQLKVISDILGWPF